MCSLFKSLKRITIARITEIMYIHKRHFNNKYLLHIKTASLPNSSSLTISLTCNLQDIPNYGNYQYIPHMR